MYVCTFIVWYVYLYVCSMVCTFVYLRCSIYFCVCYVWCVWFYVWCVVRIFACLMCGAYLYLSEMWRSCLTRGIEFVVIVSFAISKFEQKEPEFFWEAALMILSEAEYWFTLRICRWRYQKQVLGAYQDGAVTSLVAYVYSIMLELCTWKTSARGAWQKMRWSPWQMCLVLRSPTSFDVPFLMKRNRSWACLKRSSVELGTPLVAALLTFMCGSSWKLSHRFCQQQEPCVHFHKIAVAALLCLCCNGVSCYAVAFQHLFESVSAATQKNDSRKNDSNKNVSQKNDSNKNDSRKNDSNKNDWQKDLKKRMPHTRMTQIRMCHRRTTHERVTRAVPTLQILCSLAQLLKESMKWASTSPRKSFLNRSFACVCSSSVEFRAVAPQVGVPLGACRPRSIHYHHVASQVAIWLCVCSHDQQGVPTLQLHPETSQLRPDSVFAVTISKRN